MPVPTDDQQEQAAVKQCQLEPRIQTVCVAEGRAKELTQAFCRSQEDHE